MPENSIMVEAIACVRKYLIVASAVRGCLGFIIIASIDSMFSSRPDQASSQWLLEAVIIVPVVRPDNTIIWVNRFNTRRYKLSFLGHGPNCLC